MNTVRLLEEREDAALSSRFNVTIVYETAQDGIRAKHLSDQLAVVVGGDQELTVNLHVWNFQVLTLPEVREIAAGTAATADVVILSLSGTEAFPAHVEDWMILWSCIEDFKDPAIYALYPDSLHQQAPIRANLLRMGRNRGLNFL